MIENKRFTIKRKDLKYAKILENGKDLTGYFFIAQAEFICDNWNKLSEENEQLKQKIISLEDARYSYKQDWKQASMDCDVYKDEINFLKDENKGLIGENEQLKKELFEARKDYILETYADNPIRRDERLKALEKELKMNDCETE